MTASKWAFSITAASVLLAVAPLDAKAVSSITFKGGSTNLDFGAFNSPAQATPNVAAAYCSSNVDTSPCSTGGSGLLSGYNAFTAKNGEGTFVNALFVAITANDTVAGGTADWYGKNVTGSLGDFKIFGGGMGDIFVSAATPSFSGIGITKAQGGNFARSFEAYNVAVNLQGYFGQRTGVISFDPLITFYNDPTQGRALGYDYMGSITLTIDEAQVPSPLPILGAASAFGFSRRLRKRIAMAAK